MNFDITFYTSNTRNFKFKNMFDHQKPTQLASENYKGRIFAQYIKYCQVLPKSFERTPANFLQVGRNPISNQARPNAYKKFRR